MNEKALRRHNIRQIRVAQQMATMTCFDMLDIARKSLRMMDGNQQIVALKLTVRELCRAHLMYLEREGLNR